MTLVRDIMQSNVITTTPETSVREVAQTLVREAIGGMPVVDGDGTVLGVVSASDVVRASAREPDVDLSFAASTPSGVDAEEDDGVGEDEGAGGFYAPDVIPEWIRPVLLGDALDDLDAQAIMTPATFHVRPEQSLKELAEFLVRGRIHRALVLEEGTLVGIVTSFDALRALADGVELPD